MQRVLREEARACPLYELPVAMESNRNCSLCGECVKFCHQDSMRLRMLRPGVELSRLKRPLTGEAFFLLALVAVAFVEVIRTTRLHRFPRCCPARRAYSSSLARRRGSGMLPPFSGYGSPARRMGGAWAAPHSRREHY